jgi:hypothetical protein
MGIPGDRYEENFSVAYDSESNVYNADVPDSDITIVVKLEPIFVDMKRKPQTSMISALAKIGGLLAFFRLSVILNFIHQILFMRMINNHFNNLNPADNNIGANLELLQSDVMHSQVSTA